MLVKDVLIPILRLDNQNGVDLKRYNVHSLVCKEWKLATNESITILNLNGLVKVSKYRKISLLAKMINEHVIAKFKNIMTLIINLPDMLNQWTDFHKKFVNKDYNFYNCGEMINDHINEGYDKNLKRYHEIYNGDFATNFVKLVASGLWYYTLIKSVYFFDDFEKSKAYMEAIIIEQLIQLKQLKHFIIKKGNIDINKLLLNLPKLKELSLTGNYHGHIAINLDKHHDLETFILIRPFENLDFLEKLPKLKNLMVINLDTDLKILSPIYKLKELESFTISTLELPVAMVLKNCQKLNHLGFINCTVNKEDLESITTSNIKSIDFIEKRDLFHDWCSKMPEDLYKNHMRNFRHTTHDIEELMISRPDININYKNNIITNKTVNRSMYYF
jgi:hypothetical protein